MSLNPHSSNGSVSNKVTSVDAVRERETTSTPGLSTLGKSARYWGLREEKKCLGFSSGHTLQSHTNIYKQSPQNG